MTDESTQLRMDRSHSLTTFLSEWKARGQDGVFSIRFCDAYAAMCAYMEDTKMTQSIHEYDTFTEHPASTPTLSFLCVLYSLSKNALEERDFMVRLWANTLESVLRTHTYEERSHQTLLSTFLRMFTSRPTIHTYEGSLPYRVGSVIQPILEHQESYYEVQRILSEYCFELGFGFHDGYINILTLGLFSFLRITHGHARQRSLVVDYLLYQTQMDLTNVPYYDEPERIRQEFTFPQGDR